jgi:chaperone modulatory protein CbpM
VETELADAQWLTEKCEFSIHELVELSGSSVEELRELVEFGAITPVNPESSNWVFPGQCLLTVRAACRLRASFDLETHGVALVISLLERIRDLEAEMEGLRAQLPGRGAKLT